MSICIQNFRNITSQTIKISDKYCTLIGNDTLTRSSICAAFDYYFSNKRLSTIDRMQNDGKLTITDLENGEPMVRAGVKSIYYTGQMDIAEEVGLGAKSIMLARLKEILLTHMGKEPILVTINEILHNLTDEDYIDEFMKSVNHYASNNLEISFEDFSETDFAKKAVFSIVDPDENKTFFYEIPQLEKNLLVLGLLESMANDSFDRIYIFDSPETKLTYSEQIIFRAIIDKISETYPVIVSTNSEIFINFTAYDSINIVDSKNEKNKTISEMIQKIAENYPVHLENISRLMEMSIGLIALFFPKIFAEPIVTNALSCKNNTIYLSNMEEIFVIISMIEYLGLPYSTSIAYDNSPYSAYLKALTVGKEV